MGSTPKAICFGVIDHNTVNGSAGNYLQLVELSNASYQGVGSYGDNSWAQPETYGSANFIFFENNVFNYSGCCENEGSAGSSANQGGGRVVARYNTFSSDNLNVQLAWHGTESSGRPRSGRTWEFYENTTSCPASTECQEVVGARGGTGLTWGNTVNFASSSGMQVFTSLDTYRTQENIGGWGVCDGSSPYDTNDGTTYFSSTVASGGGTQTITVSGSSPGWTTNQWVLNGAPYSVHDVTQNTGSEITANTANTLTIAYSGISRAWYPANGDSIQILRATVCIDQQEECPGTLYSGVPASPSSSAKETPSPTYAWMNSFSESDFRHWSLLFRYSRESFLIAITIPRQPIRQRKTSSTSPFNGSSGVGHGTLANRPTSCTPSSNGGTEGTAYWETDHNQLDFCIATNTWSTTTSSPASYTPYTYPHPLTQDQDPPLLLRRTWWQPRNDLYRQLESSLLVHPPTRGLSPFHVPSHQFAQTLRSYPLLHFLFTRRLPAPSTRLLG